jgi:hypothetical protein
VLMVIIKEIILNICDGSVIFSASSRHIDFSF